MHTILSDKISVINQYFHELRDIHIQSDCIKFEANIIKIGTIAAYELSKNFEYKVVKTRTPMTYTRSRVLKHQVVIAAILRAGLPVQRGSLEVFPGAERAFIGVSRYGKPSKKGYKIKIDYLASPSLQNKQLIIVDTMLATGNTIIDTYDVLVRNFGQPVSTGIIGIIASRQGLNNVLRRLPKAYVIVGTVDPELSHNFYIVPGLGDAGDLLFGTKEHLKKEE